MDKRFKNNGLSTIRPVSVEKRIKNCGLSMGFGLLVEKPCCGASGGGCAQTENELSTIQRNEKQYFC